MIETTRAELWGGVKRDVNRREKEKEKSFLKLARFAPALMELWRPSHHQGTRDDKSLGCSSCEERSRRGEVTIKTVPVRGADPAAAL